MSISPKESQAVVSMALANIARIAKNADAKEQAGALEAIEKQVALARMVMEGQKKKAKKAKRGKKRKAEADPETETPTPSE